MTGKLSQTGRQGEGEQKVGHRQQHLLLLLQPDLGILVLALGAMPVATGVIAVLHLLTIRADIHLPTQRFGSAGFNGLHDL
jgi:hypothetical protein